MGVGVGVSVLFIRLYMLFLNIEQRNQKTQCKDGQSFAIYRAIQSLSEIYVRSRVTIRIDIHSTQHTI